MNYLYMMWLRTIALRAKETKQIVFMTAHDSINHQSSCGHGYDPEYKLTIRLYN